MNNHKLQGITQIDIKKYKLVQNGLKIFKRHQNDYINKLFNL
jgi:hypothetical protein